VEAAVQDPTEWPALSATEVPVQEHDSTIALFSDIVQTVSLVLQQSGLHL